MVKGVLLNVRGLYDTALHKNKWSKLRLLLQCSGADFAVLTETHIHGGDIPWGLDGAALSLAPNKGSFKGVAVVPLVAGCTVKKEWEASGRAVKCEVTTRGMPPLKVGAVYAPSCDSGRTAFFDNLRGKMDDTHILVGDFNCTLSQEDKSGTWRPTNSSSTLRNLIDFLEMEDSQPPGADHTWYGPGRDTSARLDRVYFSSEVLAAVNNTLPSLSDHRMVTFVVEGLDSISAPRVPVWRAKQEWFNSPSLCDAVNRVALSYLHLRGAELIQQWDGVKKKIKRAVITHRFEEAKEAQLWSGGWVVPRELTRVSPGHASLSPTGTMILETMVTKRRQMYTRNRDTRKELPDKALSSLINREVADQTFRGLRCTAQDPLQTALPGMSRVIHTHFQERFVSSAVTTTVLSQFIKPLPTAVGQLGDPILKDEIETFMRHTKPNSAPGMDGLPYRAYTRCHALLHLFTSLLNAVLDLGQVPPSWKDAVIRCIPKEGKDLSLPDSYRPISLCCTDFKTLMGIFANRFQDIVPFRCSQTGYLRHCSSHIAALRVADHFARFPSQKPVLLDYDKAYDRVSHEWIQTVLEKSGFPERPLTVILNCLDGMTSRVLINNTLTEKIVHGCGVRQGDPFAPLLFLLCIDPLLERLDQEKIFFHAHCDDLILGVNKGNIAQATAALRDYDKATGSRVNFGKTSIITTLKTLPFQHPFQCKGGDRYLGLWLRPNGKLKTMPHLLEELESTMKRWKNFHLSWAGRETILSSYLRPKYLYQLTVVDTSLSSFIELEKWFLSSSITFDRAIKHQYPLSEAKMRSRITRLRLRPLSDALRDRRVSLLLRISNTGLSYFPHTSIKRMTGPCASEPLHVFKDLAKWAIPTKFSTAKDAIDAYKKQVKERELKPPQWSDGQKELAALHKTDWPELFKRLRKTKVRAPVLSFAWKLANRKVHTSYEVTRCPFCTDNLTTKHILNGDCEALNIPKGAYEAVFTPPHTEMEMEPKLITLWSIWKAWCHYTHTTTDNPKPCLVSNVFKEVYSVESGRLL